MNAEAIVEEIKSSGGQLILIDGGLKAKALNESTRQLVKDNKDEIILFMASQNKPFIKNGSELIIPSGCHSKYKWWEDGQSIFETLLEIDAPDSLIDCHIGKLGSPKHYQQWQAILKQRIAARGTFPKEDCPSLMELFKDLKPGDTP